MNARYFIQVTQCQIHKRVSLHRVEKKEKNGAPKGTLELPTFWFLA
jgi:hypothetical protein